MKNKKFVNIEIDGQENIGVIDLGIIDSSDSETGRAEQIKQVIKEKLPKAIESHFDSEIKIVELNVISIFGHIQVKAVVLILDEEDEDECSKEEVSLVETWVY